MSLLIEYKETFAHCNWFKFYCAAMKTRNALKFSAKIAENEYNSLSFTIKVEVAFSTIRNWQICVLQYFGGPVSRGGLPGGFSAV